MQTARCSLRTGAERSAASSRCVYAWFAIPISSVPRWTFLHGVEFLRWCVCSGVRFLCKCHAGCWERIDPREVQSCNLKFNRMKVPLNVFIRLSNLRLSPWLWYYNAYSSHYIYVIHAKINMARNRYRADILIYKVDIMWRIVIHQ